MIFLQDVNLTLGRGEKKQEESEWWQVAMATAAQQLVAVSELLNTVLKLA